MTGFTTKTVNGSASNEGFTLGFEEGEGALGGGEVSITKEGVSELKGAWDELKDTLSIPAPPPAPPSPGPPPNQ